ncbi:keratin, type I cytoskeletal 19 [Nothobranchius furzeri]|uniref:keratin, type I cytoskeletal 19 n=1 Tax=Nothobranchius furzeri TaxID=105023 RepID=UPI00077D4B70|nr:keratin, type I cytoskeletal 19 [Nothobranchius furzeri]
MSVGQQSRIFSSSSSQGGRTQRRSVGRSFQNHTPSVYGGAGGFGTRISQFSSSSCYSGSLGSDEVRVTDGGKVRMQNLNNRLASYLEKVHSLKKKNKDLELNINKFYVKHTVAPNDYSNYFSIIHDLRVQIAKMRSENQSIILQVDSAKLAAEDIRMKYELELSVQKMVEADLFRLRGIRDSLTLINSSLETSAENLKEEQACMSRNHKEELEQVRAQGIGDVNVEVDSTKSADLTQILEEMRVQYDAVMKNNKMEVETWFQSKVETLQHQIFSCSTEVKTYHTEISELKRTYQTLEINRQALQAEVQGLQRNLVEVNGQYAFRLSQHQETISTMETKLQEMKASLEQLQIKYTLLLELKPRLEMEIEEYRRLLEGDKFQKKKKAVIITKVTSEVEELKPHIEKRVRTIVEEIVNGKVISSTVDTKVQTIQ